MNNETRWKQRFHNFENGYVVLYRMIQRNEESPEDEGLQMALVQAFEFTFELAWNVMKDYLEDEGYEEIGNSKQAVRVAFRAGLISEAEKWMDSIKRRNLTSHTYNKEILQETVRFIQDEFFPIVRDLREELKGKL